ncbi:hypothetical protein PSP31121_05712 [Pandoraea sputorum]|uniref:Uncharacterized protein n=1 Tax=Pandoraea sputorum TaxID=93222 RepID=A0A5E5BNL5_9BURK|nr:hypothetical protein PSP31121_05712 [Pandoraea sputorum]
MLDVTDVIENETLEAIELGQFLRQAQIAFGGQQTLHERRGGREQYRATKFDQGVSQGAGEMALARARAADGHDVDCVFEECAALQPLHLHPGGRVEAIQVECPEGLAWCKFRLLSQTFDASPDLGRLLNALELQQKRLMRQSFLGRAQRRRLDGLAHGREIQGAQQRQQFIARTGHVGSSTESDGRTPTNQ